VYNCLHVGASHDDLTLLNKDLGEYILEVGGVKVTIEPETKDGKPVPKHLQDALTNIVVSAIAAIVCGEYEKLQ
jgi:hypothetical protein